MTAIAIVSDPIELQFRSSGYRARGLRIGFVPTMGFLHAGHTTLIERAKRDNDVVVVSIFVNPTQFGPNEDLTRYPRDEAGDLDKCRAAGASVVFLPSAEVMYPQGFQTTVSVTGVSQGLCGASRPGHFAGVATVVLKLLNLAEPHTAYFGEKDFQQLAVIRTLVRDLALAVRIEGVPTVREADGLAMSSRNVYLSPSERQDALVIKRALDAVTAAARAGERNRDKLVAIGKTIVVEKAKLDYLELVDADTLQPRETIAPPTRALVAAFVGKTRLIDNCAVL